MKILLLFSILWTFVRSRSRTPSKGPPDCWVLDDPTSFSYSTVKPKSGYSIDDLCMLYTKSPVYPPKDAVSLFIVLGIDQYKGEFNLPQDYFSNVPNLRNITFGGLNSSSYSVFKGLSNLKYLSINYFNADDVNLYTSQYNQNTSSTLKVLDPNSFSGLGQLEEL
jgi:hypothetical protein